MDYKTERIQHKQCSEKLLSKSRIFFFASNHPWIKFRDEFAPNNLFCGAQLQRSRRLTTEIGNDENEWKKSSMPTGGGAVNVKMRGCLREIAECNLRSFLCSPRAVIFALVFLAFICSRALMLVSQGYGFLWNCESWPESRGVVVPTQCVLVPKVHFVFCTCGLTGAAAAVGTNISSKKGNCTLLLLAKLSFLHFTFTFNPYTYML